MLPNRFSVLPIKQRRDEGAGPTPWNTLHLEPQETIVIGPLHPVSNGESQEVAVAGDSTLEIVRGDLDKLKDVARRLYSQYPASAEGTWTLDDYLVGVADLEIAIDRAMALDPCSRERFEAEKYARNRRATELYFRGRLCLQTNTLGRFRKKVGDKGVHWAPTELSRQADRLAAEPLRHIYKATQACLESL